MLHIENLIRICFSHRAFFGLAFRIPILLSFFFSFFPISYHPCIHSVFVISICQLPVASFHFPLRIVLFFLCRNNDSAAILIEIFPWTHKTFTLNSSNCLLCAATYILRPITFRLRFAYHITLMVEIIFVVSPRRALPVFVSVSACVCMSLCALFYVYLYPSNYKSLTFLRHCPEIRFIFQIYLNKIEKKNTKRFRWFAERYVSGGILKRQAHATISVETCWKAVSAFILSLAWCKAV